MSFDIEMVSAKIPYSQYLDKHKYFVNPNFPTHSLWTVPYARYLHMAEPYGSTIVVDCKHMQQSTIELLLEFLSAPKTLVIGFDLQHDFLCFQRTFGKIPCTTSQEFKNFPTQIQLEYIADHPLKNIRFFDLKCVLDMVQNNEIPYDMAEKWIQYGIIPERGTLWGLAQCLLGLDVDKYNITYYKNISSIFNEIGTSPEDRLRIP